MKRKNELLKDELRLAEQALPGKVRKHIEQHRGALIPA